MREPFCKCPNSVISGSFSNKTDLTEKKAYGTVKEGKVFRNAFLDFPEREIGEVKDTDEAAIQYFEERFALVEKELAKVEEKIANTQNKGSYLMKILHLKNTLPETDALGDFERLYNRLCQHEEQLEGMIAANRLKNLEIKTALLAELETATQSSEWKSASEAVKTIQGKWLKTGAVAEDKKPEVEGRYKELTQGFYDRRAAFYADLEKMMVEKEALYVAFLEKAEKQLTSAGVANMKAVQDALRQEWKELGRIKREKQNAFWEQFQALMKKSWNEARKKKSSGQKTDFQSNKKSKEEFIEKLKELNKALVPGVDLNTVKQDWKALGPVNRKDVKDLQSAYLVQLDMLSEKIFLEGMVNKRLKGKDKGADPKRLRQRILRDLLERDKRELNAFRDNLEKFNTSGGFHDMIGGKLEQQERKVEVKKMILSQLKSAE